MPMDDNGTIRMNMDDSSQIMMSLMGQLDRTLRSFESQLKDLTNVVKGFNKDYTSSSRSSFSSRQTISNTNFSDWNRQFGRDTFKELDKIFTDRIKGIGENVSKEQRDLDVAYKNFKKNAMLQLEWSNKNAEEIYERDKANARNVHEEKEAEKKYWREKKKNRIEYHKLLEEEKEETNRKKKYVATRGEEEISKQRKIGAAYQENASKISNATNWNNNSAYLSMRTMFSNQNKTEKEQLEEIRDEQLDILRSAKAALESFIKNNKDLTDEDKELFKKQLAQYDKDIKIREDWKYTGEVFARAGKDLATAGKNIINNLGRNIMKTVEDKYLSSYKEGFQNVYNSIESTRNTVSARLKLDQGGYSALQEEIQAEIQAQGLESTVSQIDVNNAIAELSAAGVTDKEMLKTLALEQAKLAASGSSLNLGNEETLNNIRQFVSSQMAQDKTQEEALDELRKTFAGIESAESYYAAQGWTSPFVNGGANLFYNASMNRAILGNWTGETATRDIQTSAAIGDALSNTGLDPQFINSIIEKFSNSTTDQLSTYLKAMKVDNDILQDVLSGEYDPEELQKTIISSFQEMLTEFSRGDTEYLTNVLEALQMDITAKEAALLMKKPIDVNVDYEGMAKAFAKDESAIKQADYLSETEKHQKKTENTMANLAKNAEKQYKGNEYVIAGMDAVEQGINAIAETAQDILSTLVSDGVKGLFGSGTGAATGNVLSSVGAGAAGTSFIGGASGLAGAGIVAVAGVAAAIAAYKYIGEPLQEWIEDSSQPTKTKELLEAYENEANLALDQYNAATEELDRLNKLTKEEQKVMLLHKGVIKDQELRNLDDSKIQELFEKNVLDEQVNLQKEAEQIIQRQQILNNEQNVRELANAAEFLVGPEGNMQGKTAEEMFNLIAGQMGNAYKDIYAQYQSFGNLSEDELTAMAMRYGASSRDIENAKRQGSLSRLVGTFATKETLLASGFDEQGAQDVMSTFGVYERNLNAYQTANDEFHTKWSQVIDRNPDKANDVAALLVRYATENGVYPELQVDQNGLPVLNDSGLPDLELGTIGKHSWRFRTGLTNVPYDNYPAMLHKGERILTASEADAYNEMSSYAVSNLVNQNRTYGNSSNVFNTNSYGVSGFESSIDKQTNSLASILNQILTVLKTLSVGTSSGTMSAAHRNVLLRNSSVSQINTLS